MGATYLEIVRLYLEPTKSHFWATWQETCEKPVGLLNTEK